MRKQKCYSCLNEKDISEFFKSHTIDGGYQKQCKICHRKWKLENSKTLGGYITKLLSRAKTHQSDSDIDRDFIIQLFKKQDYKCNLTGLSFEYSNSTTSYHNPLAPSLDQINPGQGYYKSNVQLVCVFINRAKGNMSDLEFKNILTKLVEERNKNEF